MAERQVGRPRLDNPRERLSGIRLRKNALRWYEALAMKEHKSVGVFIQGLLEEKHAKETKKKS